MNLEHYKPAIKAALVAFVFSASATILYSSMLPTSLATPLGILIGGVLAYGIVKKLKG